VCRMIVDGKKIAEEVRDGLKKDLALLPRVPTLGFIRAGDDLVAEKFVAMKRKTALGLGIKVVESQINPGADTETAIAVVKEIASKSDGVLVQMPLARNIDTEKVLAAVPLKQDVDAMGERSGKLVLTPVTAAIKEILERYNVSVTGKKVTVIGAGRLVGAPTAAWLKEQGAEVFVFTRENGDFVSTTKESDIIVLGAGKVGILEPSMVKPGVVILDGGTTESEGAIAGDAQPSCAQIASVFTPVPGGIGPIAVAMIFRNLFELVRRR